MPLISGGSVSEHPFAGGGQLGKTLKRLGLGGEPIHYPALDAGGDGDGLLPVRPASHCPPSQGIGVESCGDYKVGVGRAGHDVIYCHVCIVAEVGLIANLFLRF